MKIVLQIFKSDDRAPLIDDDGNLHVYKNLLEVWAFIETPDGTKWDVAHITKPEKLLEVLDKTMRATVKEGIELGMLPEDAA